MSVYAKYNYPSKLYKSSDDLNEQLLYMSPFDKSDPPVIPNSMGNFVTVQNMTRRSIQTNGPLGNPKALIFVPSARGNVNALVYDLSSGVVESNSHLFSTLARYTGDDAPIQTKCLRAAIKISNTSNQADRSSTVAILQISSAINFEYTSTASLNLTTDCAGEILQMVRTHPKSRIYTAEQLCTNDNCLIVAPATSSSYSSYGDSLFLGGAFSDGNSKLCFQNAQKDMSMNNVIVLFETASAINDYLITLQSQDGMRFQAFSLLGTLQKPPIVAKDRKRLDDTHKGVQDNGSNLVDLQKLGEIAIKNMEKKRDRAAKLIQSRYRSMPKKKGAGSSTTASTKPKYYDISKDITVGAQRKPIGS